MADLPSFHGIIGRSAAMQALFGQIGSVAQHDVSVTGPLLSTNSARVLTAGPV